VKPVNTEACFYITYTMTLQEADLIQRMCDGYTSLARELVKISAKFPEKEEVLQQMLFRLANGIGKEITQAQDALAVHQGKKVAVPAETLSWLQAQAEELRALKKERE
jgi:hypothetical protein